MVHKSFNDILRADSTVNNIWNFAKRLQCQKLLCKGTNITKKKRSEIIIPAAETVQTSKIQDLMVREIWKRDSLIKINKD